MRLKIIALCFNFVLALVFVFGQTSANFSKPQIQSQLQTVSVKEAAGEPLSPAVLVEKNFSKQVILSESRTTTSITPAVVSIKIVANNITWPSLDRQITDLENWFWETSDQKLKFETSVVYTSFTEVPFVAYNYASDPTLEGVDVPWYDQNITPLAERFDMVLLLLNTNDWTKTAVKGWTLEDNKKLVRIQVGVSEDEESYNPEDPFTPVSAFVDYGRHEIIHALFLLTSQEDITHEYWFEGRFSEIFKEIDYSKL